MNNENDKATAGTLANEDAHDQQTTKPVSIGLTKQSSLRSRFNDVVHQAKASIVAVTEHENTKAAIYWSRKTGAELADQASELGRDALHSDLGKAATKGAAVGAVAGIPLPVIGPIGGALVGAGVGAYLNIKHGLGRTKQVDVEVGNTQHQTPGDVIADLKKLEEIHQAGIVTDAEFEQQKAKLLSRI